MSLFIFSHLLPVFILTLSWLHFVPQSMGEFKWTPNNLIKDFGKNNGSFDVIKGTGTFVYCRAAIDYGYDNNQAKQPERVS